MLNKAGIKADPVLISTRENGVPVYPNRTVFNAVIAAAEIEGKQVLLDATNKFSFVKYFAISRFKLDRSSYK
jgi:hypothetical protein